MTETQFVQWAILSIFGLAGWLMKRTITSIEEKQKELENAQILFQQNYLHKDDFREFKMELRGMFEEIKQDIRELKK